MSTIDFIVDTSLGHHCEGVTLPTIGHNHSWKRNTVYLLYNQLTNCGECKWLCHMINSCYKFLWCYFRNILVLFVYQLFVSSLRICLDWFQTGLDWFYTILIVSLQPRKNDILHLPINFDKIEANEYIVFNKCWHYLVRAPVILGCLVQYFYSMNDRIQWSQPKEDRLAAHNLLMPFETIAWITAHLHYCAR